jgi:hypothetical protein
MLTAPTAPRCEPNAAARSDRSCDAAAPVGCGGWYASSLELQRGLQVTEHHGWPTAGNDTLWDVLSFD